MTSDQTSINPENIEDKSILFETTHCLDWIMVFDQVYQEQKSKYECKRLVFDGHRNFLPKDHKLRGKIDLLVSRQLKSLFGKDVDVDVVVNDNNDDDDDDDDDDDVPELTDLSVERTLKEFYDGNELFARSTRCPWSAV